jgi:hypothetical protein
MSKRQDGQKQQMACFLISLKRPSARESLSDLETREENLRGNSAAGTQKQSFQPASNLHHR